MILICPYKCFVFFIELKFDKTHLMDPYSINIKCIERLIKENEKRKQKLRKINSTKLLYGMLIFLVLFLLLYQI